MASPAILPAYLFLCLVIGGSTQAVWGNALLQLMAIAILGWAMLTRDPQPLTRAGKQLTMLIAAVVLLFAVQLLPLPPSLWSSIPGRSFIAEGFAGLGMAPPWLQISQSPYDTLASAMTLLPPLAVAIGLTRLRHWSSAWLLGAIVAGAMVSVLFGVLQLTNGDGPWYLHRVTNIGVAVGTFANGNHFATLLLVTIPALAALAAAGWRGAGDKRKSFVPGAMAIAAGAALAIGAIMNSSAAFLLLSLPVAAASGMIVMRLGRAQLRRGWLAIALLLAVAGASLIIVGNRFPAWGTTASIESRTKFWSRTVEAIGHEGLLGTGFGTFEQAYSRYEDPTGVDRFYVNHAHNDYLEIALEGGLPAALILLMFLAWWLRQSRDAWATPAGTVAQKAAAVASAAILLHSLLDFPLRTSAIMAAMAVCLALLAGARGKPGADLPEERQPARHATL